MTFFLALVVGLLFGGSVIWLILRGESRNVYERAKAEGESERVAMNERMQARDAQIEELKTTVAARERELARVRAESAGLLAERAAASERIAALSDAQEKLADSFKALSAEALRSNNQTFLDLATTALSRFQDGAKEDLDARQKAIDQVVQPLRESLGKVDDKIRDLEVSRAAAYAGLSEQVSALVATQTQLRAETGNLVRALRSPAARGRWGEIQLRRVVEMAGMIERCDFVEQESVDTENGRLRPDMVIQLPAGRRIVVDSKVPLSAYLEATEAGDDAVRAERLKEHAQQVRTHLRKLGEKAYWDQFQPAPEFAVAFLPGETFFGAALEHDPGLIEYGIENRVILATPTTLIALLKAVAFGWRQEAVAANAQAVSELGRVLYDRIRSMAEHFERLGDNLARSVSSYNSAIGSLESRVLVAARRFRDLGSSTQAEIPEPEQVEITPRELAATAAE